jgi:hypothetical protein
MAPEGKFPADGEDLMTETPSEHPAQAQFC